MENKPWWKSLTIQAVAFIGFLQTVPDILSEINKIVPDMNLNENPIVIKVLTGISIILAIYGRIRAKSAIK